MMEPFVSIIVPVYKVPEQYLRKCIESTMTQTLKKIEILLVDDGSPDQCGEICDEYAEKDKRIRVLHKKNGGLSSARNYGCKAAQGKWIMFVDGDDWIEPDMCVNFATIVLFPDGLYDAALYAGNYWFLGYKNVMIRFLLPAIVLNAIWTVHNKGKYTVRLYLLIIISIATEWMVDCKTGLIGIIIVVATMIIFTRKQLPKFINARNGLLFIGVLSIALATTSLLDEFSDLLLDMGETVSVFSRQAVWFRAIQLFVKSPVWGYGIRTNDGYRELINLSTGWGYFSHPHNYILYVLIQGGILELMLISYLIIKVTRMCLANRNNYMAKMLLVFYIASFVMGITESLVGYTLLFPIALYVGLLYEEEDYESISGRT